LDVLEAVFGEDCGFGGVVYWVVFFLVVCSMFVFVKFSCWCCEVWGCCGLMECVRDVINVMKVLYWCEFLVLSCYFVLVFGF